MCNSQQSLFRSIQNVKNIGIHGHFLLHTSALVYAFLNGKMCISTHVCVDIGFENALNQNGNFVPVY